MNAFISAEACSRILKKLDDLASQHAVSVLFAIESGSRAWGFLSPDSDYDCRFVYLRQRDVYLSLWPSRDVIESPLEGDLDVNGWDIAKAIRLLCKGNAVVLEWLSSPVTYRAEAGCRERFLDFARQVAHPDRVARHYLHLGEGQLRHYLSPGGTMAQKKIFYALRPAAALRWLRFHPGEAVAPMHLPTLVDECRMPTDVAVFTTDLIARKAGTRELGNATLPAFVVDFMMAEFNEARASLPRAPCEVRPGERAIADALFREMLQTFG